MTPSTCSVQKKTGGQQEGEHGWVQHVQREHYQRNVLRVLQSIEEVNPKYPCLSLSNASLVLPSNMCCVQLIINANNRVLTSAVWAVDWAKRDHVHFIFCLRPQVPINKADTGCSRSGRWFLTKDRIDLRLVMSSLISFFLHDLYKRNLLKT